MTLSIAPRIDFSHIDMIVRDLERREFFNRHPHNIAVTDGFGLCDECDGVQGLAVLAWSWPISGSNSNGNAASCTDVHCIRAVIDSAHDDGADPESVDCDYPDGFTPSPAIVGIAA